MECAVFRAIFRPAAEMADGCFRVGEFGLANVAVVGIGGSSFGFICMIFLTLLGGGGSSWLLVALPDSVRFCWITGDVSGERFMAAGGKANALSTSMALSNALGPIEVAGVGGNFARGIISSQHGKKKIHEPWWALR